MCFDLLNATPIISYIEYVGRKRKKVKRMTDLVPDNGEEGSVDENEELPEAWGREARARSERSEALVRMKKWWSDRHPSTCFVYKSHIPHQNNCSLPSSQCFY